MYLHILLNVAESDLHNCDGRANASWCVDVVKAFAQRLRGVDYLVNYRVAIICQRGL